MRGAHLIPLAFACLSMPVSARAESGAEAFKNDCQACHQSTGLGIPGAFPALKGSAIALGEPAGAIARVLDGKGAMPAFRNQLIDSQIAGALTYIRSTWGNSASPVTAADVAIVRAAKPAK